MPRKTLEQLKRGLTKTVVRPVEFHRTLTYFDQRLPAVLTTPSMIGQMEVASARVLQPYLPKGAISLGTHINVSHRAPARLGEKLRTTASFARVYKPKNGGRLRYVFEVEARVGKRLVGVGTVERAVVNHSQENEHAAARKRRPRPRHRTRK